MIDNIRHLLDGLRNGKKGKREYDFGGFLSREAGWRENIDISKDNDEHARRMEFIATADAILRPYVQITAESFFAENHPEIEIQHYNHKRTTGDSSYGLVIYYDSTEKNHMFGLSLMLYENGQGKKWIEAQSSSYEPGINVPIDSPNFDEQIKQAIANKLGLTSKDIRFR